MSKPASRARTVQPIEKASCIRSPTVLTSCGYPGGRREYVSHREPMLNKGWLVATSRLRRAARNSRFFADRHFLRRQTAKPEDEEDADPEEQHVERNHVRSEPHRVCVGPR